MKHNCGTPFHSPKTRTLFYIILCAIVALMGCSEKSPAALPNFEEVEIGESDGTQSSKLSARLNTNLSPGLVGINSVYIAEPVIGPEVSGINASSLHHAIEEAFIAESSMVQVKQKPVGATPCEAARFYNADGCLLVIVDVYSELEGSALAAAQKAKVSFTLELIQTSTKKIVFQNHLNFVDQDLTENLFNAAETVQQKGGSSGYATATSVFSRGIRKAIRELDDLRTKQFLKK